MIFRYLADFSKFSRFLWFFVIWPIFQNFSDFCDFSIFGRFFKIFPIFVIFRYLAENQNFSDFCDFSIFGRFFKFPNFSILDDFRLLLDFWNYLGCPFLRRKFWCEVSSYYNKSGWSHAMVGMSCQLSAFDIYRASLYLEIALDAGLVDADSKSSFYIKSWAG